MARGSKAQRARNSRGREEQEAMAALSRRLLAGSPEEALSLLERADVLRCQVVPAGTNYTFAVLMSAGDVGRFLAIYKPRRGENPLWDFPHGTLYQRERAAYLTSRHLGWPRIPPTVIRDGPLGVGSVQLYVPTEEQWDFSILVRHRREEMMEIALFDLLANNADRKAGHCLMGVDSRVWAIDHGLTFNVAPKLRTVLWDYCGEAIPERMLNDLECLKDGGPRQRALRALLRPHLEPAEIETLFRRLEQILRTRRFPQLDPRRNVPWPFV